MSKRGHRVYYRHTEAERERVPFLVVVVVSFILGVAVAATFAHFH